MFEQEDDVGLCGRKPSIWKKTIPEDKGQAGSRLWCAETVCQTRVSSRGVVVPRWGRAFSGCGKNLGFLLIEMKDIKGVWAEEQNDNLYFKRVSLSKVEAEESDVGLLWFSVLFWVNFVRVNFADFQRMCPFPLVVVKLMGLGLSVIFFWFFFYM